MGFEILASRKLAAVELDEYHKHRERELELSDQRFSRRNVVQMLYSAPILTFGLQPSLALSQSAFGAQHLHYGTVVPVSPINGLLGANFSQPVAVPQLEYIVSEFVRALFELYNPTQNTMYNPLRVQMGTAQRGLTHNARAYFEIEPESAIAIEHNSFQARRQNEGASFYLARSRDQKSQRGFQVVRV